MTSPDTDLAPDLPAIPLPDPAREAAAAARRVARHGDAETAIIGLRRLAHQGDDTAAASLAELLAFRGEWTACIRYAGRLIANPDAVSTENVFIDMVRLLGRAGEETGRWDAVVDWACTAANNGRSESRRAWLDRLCAYARGRGVRPETLVRLFATEGWRPATKAQAEAWYRNASAAIHEQPLSARLDAGTVAESLFALSLLPDLEEETLRLYEAHTPALGFHAAVCVARILAGRGQPDRAWVVLTTKLHCWQPIEEVQVAPVILLTDPALRPLMTAERRAIVLATPRGPQADA